MFTSLGLTADPRAHTRAGFWQVAVRDQPPVLRDPAGLPQRLDGLVDHLGVPDLAVVECGDRLGPVAGFDQAEDLASVEAVPALDLARADERGEVAHRVLLSGVGSSFSAWSSWPIACTISTLACRTRLRAPCVRTRSASFSLPRSTERLARTSSRARWAVSIFIAASRFMSESNTCTSLG